MQNHYDVNPIKAYVNKSLLYNDKLMTGRVECTIISIGFYEGETPTFDIILEDGSMFNYIPLSEITYVKEAKNMSLIDLVYHNSKSIEVTLNYFSYLKDSKIMAYFKNIDSWKKVDDYVCTIDWYKGNDLLHLLMVGGCFALLPNHKIKINDEDMSFNKYIKLKNTYKV